MVAPAEVTFAPLLFGCIAFMLLAGSSVLGFFVTYQKRLLRQQLHLRNTELTYQQHLLTAIIEAQETERERIGRDLHDDIGSTISTAKLLLNRLAGLPAHADNTELLALLTDILGKAVQNVRSISHTLYPAVLARFGLAEALQDLVDVCNETGTIPIDLEIAYSQPLALAQELALYRISQELIHNAFKHAHGATWVRVQLSQQSSALTLLVEDNGSGLPAVPTPTTSLPGKGIGLRNIEVRVQMLQGRLVQHSAPGQGTRMLIELPVRTVQ
jgi:two-component system NarL family sensor kinase